MPNLSTRSDEPALPPSPPEAWEPLIRLARLAGRPLERFLRIQAASGLLLVVAAAVALVMANSHWAHAYRTFWDLSVGLRVGSFSFERTILWFVNDALMVVFFFVVGMEIRREIHHGELSEWRRAALPAAAALGGMLAPASLFLLFSGSGQARGGWGIPMATDIAFAVGVLTLLGKRVPPALRVLLLALAVIDDLGAIVVIALFYSSGVAFMGLVVALAGMLGIFGMQRLGVRAKFAYLLPAGILWGGVYLAGVHPTIAGVIVGLVTPVRAWLGPEGFRVGVQKELERLAQGSRFSSHELSDALKQVDAARREAMSPAESLIEALHPWVAFGIMPVFALANAGVTWTASSLDASSLRVSTGVFVGLLVGKPVGILATMLLTLKLRLGVLPRGLSLRNLVVLGVVSGIGFTMALFVAELAFVDQRLLNAAKMGVLAASAGAAALGLLLGRVLLPSRHALEAASTADEAESSTEA